MQHADALAQLAREIARSRNRLALERLARAGLMLLLALAAWATLWLSGAPSRLPPLAQSLAVICALAGFAWLALRARGAYARPTEAEARARLARDSGLDAAAFEALDDLPAKLDPAGIALWRREQDRARERAERARSAPLRLALNDVDRFRLRYVLLILFTGGLLFANASAPDRLLRAFVPDPGPLVGDAPMEIEAWLTPASYTRAPPISVSDRIGARIETPPSVSATVRLTGPRGAPRLIYEGQGGRRETRFVRTTDGAYEARLDIPGRGRLKIVRFLERATWRIAPGRDAAPLAAFTAMPAVLENGRLSFGWSARDDYGVRAMSLRITPVNPPEGLRAAGFIDTPFETPAGDPREASAEITLDLAAHPFAGMRVDVRVIAVDALGQIGASEPTRLELPEKVFLQPLARAAIEIRKMILWERRPYEPARPAPGGPALLQWFEPVFGAQWLAIRTDDQDPRLERAPDAIRRAGRFIDALTMAPRDGYFRDNAVFLGFRKARAELNVAREIGETERAADTLWNTALRAEYGGAADARRALEAAQRALADALASGASQERIRELMRALREATDNYLRALVQEAMRSGQQPQTQEDTQEQTEMSQRDIDELMREVQRLSEEGRTAEAQALLQQLANLLANLDVRLSEGGEGQDGGEGGEGGDQQLSQSMEALSNAIGEQRALNDETQQQAAQGGEQGDQDGAGLAQRQNAIREGLNEAQRQAGEAGAPSSDALANAERAMRRSEEALRRGDYEGARAAQDDALANLRRGAGELAAEMRRRGDRDGDRGGGERDPLGRTTTGSGSGDGETNVPTQADRVRAREILDDIRRRAQDPNRPEAERDYLRRLLDRFNGA